MSISEVFSKVPELPEEFDAWVKDVAMPYSKYMFTFRDALGYRKGYCTHCEKIVDLDYRNYKTIDDEAFRNCLNKHNDKGFCPDCLSRVIFKDNGRPKGNIYDFDKTIVLQRIEGTQIAVLRFFDLVRNYCKCDCSPVKTQTTEEYRLFLDIENRKSEMHYRKCTYNDKWSYYRGGNRVFGVGELLNAEPWEKMKNPKTSLRRYGLSTLCGFGNELIQEAFGDTNFKYLNLSAYDELKRSNKNYVKYMECFCENPRATEYLMKFGFADLFSEYLIKSHPGNIFNMKATTPEQLLKLPKEYIKYFKQYKDQTCERLKYLQNVAKANIPFKDAISLFENVSAYAFEYTWEIILKYTTKTKASNYVQKQATGKLLPTEDYADYIRDCKTLGFDLTQNSVLFPKNLNEAHQRTIELVAANERAEQAKAKANENGAIKELSSKLEYLEFHSNGLFIKPASSVKEIIDKGAELKICVGQSTQNYIKNYAKGISYILFIAKEETPNTPFYCVEMSNIGSLLQIRGKGNCGPTADVKAFIEKYKKYLASCKQMKKGA